MDRQRAWMRMGLLLVGLLTPGTLATGEIVHFADPAVEAAVREEMGCPAPMPLVSWRLLDMRKLIVWSSDAESLQGMEYALNLRSMEATYNRISDLTRGCPIRS